MHTDAHEEVLKSELGFVAAILLQAMGFSKSMGWTGQNFGWEKRLFTTLHTL